MTCRVILGTYLIFDCEFFRVYRRVDWKKEADTDSNDDKVCG